jgi:glycosyltransferase involved in cell wall biosynthesis
MKIWFTEIGEPLPIEENVRLHRYGQMTRFLAQRGHDVTWWTSTFSHAKKEFIRSVESEEIVDGVQLKILHGPGYKNSISLQRITHQSHFANTYFERAQKEPLPDIIISPIPTIEVGDRNVVFGRDHRIPVITDIRDEWPDEFVDLAPKPLRGIARAVLRPAFTKMKGICSGSAGIIGVSQRQVNYGLRFATRMMGPNDAVVPLGYSAMSPSRDSIEQAKIWWKQFGVNEDAFIICLFSNLNPLLDLETVIAAAHILEEEFPLQIFICGHGRTLEKLKKLARGCPSVIFPGWIDKSQIAALMEYASVGIAPYAKNTRMSLPNKPFEYMAGGLPVLSSIEGEFEGIIQKHECGITYQADSVENLCAAIRKLKQEPALAKKMGKNSREALIKNYSMEQIFAKFETFLEQVIERHSDSKN